MYFHYILTPRSRVLLEKITGSQLVKKFLAFYGTRRFITAITSAHHLPLSWATSIQSIPSHPTPWRSILILSSHLCLVLPSSRCPSGFPTKSLYTPLHEQCIFIAVENNLNLMNMHELCKRFPLAACIASTIRIAHLPQQCHNSKFVIFQEKRLKFLMCYNFLRAQRWHSCSPAASFANCVMTLYLLKVHLQTFYYIPVTQTFQIFNYFINQL